MSADIQVRPARADDLETIVRFNAAMALETEHKTLDAATLRAGVSAVLEDAGKGRYFMADSAGQALGQTMLTWEWSDWRNGVFWWIQSVYVAPDQRGRGIYSALYRHILDAARAAPDVCGIRLYVDKTNRSASRVYEALGMQAAHYNMYEVDFVLAEPDQAASSS